MTDRVVLEVDVAAPPEVVYDFFTQAELLCRWMGVDAELEARPGGVFRFAIAPGQFCSGRYVEADRPRRVVFTWGYESDAMPVEPGSTTVEVDIEAVGGGTRVRLVHSGLDAAMRAMHEDGWRRFLPRLAAVAVGRPAGFDPAAAYQDGSLPEIPEGEIPSEPR